MSHGDRARGAAALGFGGGIGAMFEQIRNGIGVAVFRGDMKRGVAVRRARVDFRTVFDEGANAGQPFLRGAVQRGAV